MVMRKRSFILDDIVRVKIPDGYFEGKIIAMPKLDKICFVEVQRGDEVRRFLLDENVTLIKEATKPIFNLKEQNSKVALSSLFIVDGKTKGYLQKYANDNFILILNKLVEECNFKVNLDILDSRVQALAESRSMTDSQSYLSISSKLLSPDVDNFIKEQFDAGFWVSENIEQVLRHEFGHLITYRYLQKNGHEPLLDKWLFEVLGKRFWQVDGMSANGKQDAFEIIAESWANPDYSETTRKIYNKIKEWL